MRLALGLLSLVLVVAGVLTSGDPQARLALGGAAAVFALVIGPFAWWLARRAPSGGTGLEVRAAGIHVAGSLEIARGEIVQAQVVDEGGQAAVVLERHGGLRSWIDVPSRDEARAFVEALGFDVARRTSQHEFDPMPLGAGILSVWCGFLLLSAWAARVSPFGSWLLLATVALSASAVAHLSRRQKITIGLDGVLLERRSRRRLVSYDELDRVEVGDRALVLELRGGERVELSVRGLAQDQRRAGGGLLGFPSAEAYLASVRERVLEAREARTRGQGAAASALLRGDKPLPRWLDELRGLLGDKHASFRRGAVSAGHLWAAVEDPTAEPSVRVAGAVALAPHLDAQGKERLRVAAAAVASPDLRAAIEECAADELAEEEALVRAVSRVVSS